MFRRLTIHSVYGGFLAGLLLLLMTPVFTRSWPEPLTATFLCLPAYQLSATLSNLLKEVFSLKRIRILRPFHLSE
jgi:hypothetical protein